MPELSNSLREKILVSKDASELEGGQCLQKALELFDQHGGGSLYWVGDLEKLGLDFGLHHMYYVPPNARGSDMTLNQADNGFPQHPVLTVREIKLIGQKQDIDIVRGIVNGGKK